MMSNDDNSMRLNFLSTLSIERAIELLESINLSSEEPDVYGGQGLIASVLRFALKTPRLTLWKLSKSLNGQMT